MVLVIVMEGLWGKEGKDEVSLALEDFMLPSALVHLYLVPSPETVIKTKLHENSVVVDKRIQNEEGCF